MDITPLVPKGRSIIESYGDNGFRISGVKYQGSVIVFSKSVLIWNVQDYRELETHSLVSTFTQPLESVELLLLGTGERMEPLNLALREAFRKLSIVIEVMDTGAACRTYNVLMAEGRLVSAALIAVKG